MKLKFTKMHGLGNDFILINNLGAAYQFTPAQIRYLADRKLGIGCDQVLVVEESNDGCSDFYYRIYNSDGSHVEQCGNGARCVIQYLVENGLSSKSVIQLQTLGRVICGQIIGPSQVRVSMGQPEFEPELIALQPTGQHSDRVLRHRHHHLAVDHGPLSAEYVLRTKQGDIMFSALSMGNPHAVIELSDSNLLLQDDYLASRAIQLQDSGLFRAGVNVNFIYRVNHEQLRLRTYERGCGFTAACGSGACASAAVALVRQLVSSPVKVSMPGGELLIEWNGDELSMQGPATHVFSGEIDVCVN